MNYDKFKTALELANELGSWPAYASYHIGLADTGDESLDNLLADLYLYNEKVHLRANQLSMKHDLPFFTGTFSG